MRITSASFLHCFLPLIYRADINSIGKTLTEVAIKDFPIKSSVKKFTIDALSRKETGKWYLHIIN